MYLPADSLEIPAGVFKSTDVPLTEPEARFNMHVSGIEVSTGQIINVGVIDSRQGGDKVDTSRRDVVIVAPQAYIAGIADKFQQDHYRVVARALSEELGDDVRVRIVAVDALGVGGDPRMKFGQRASLVAGHFDESARLMAEAVAGALPVSLGEQSEVMMLSYSMGAAISPDMLGPLHEMTGCGVIGRLPIIEMVDNKWRFPGRLIGLMVKEDRQTDRYLATNKHGQSWSLAPIDRREKDETLGAISDAEKECRRSMGKVATILTTLAQGLGLHRGLSDVRLYELSKQFPDLQFTFMHGESSGVSTAKDNERSARVIVGRLGEGSAEVIKLTAGDGEGIHHPVFHSMQALDIIARQVLAPIIRTASVIRDTNNSPDVADYWYHPRTYRPHNYAVDARIQQDLSLPLVSHERAEPHGLRHIFSFGTAILKLVLTAGYSANPDRINGSRYVRLIAGRRAALRARLHALANAQ
jgi:hypothetical protein